MLSKLIEKIKDKKYYLILVVVFFALLIFINQPFDTEKCRYEVKNSEELVGQTDFIMAQSKVSQNFKAERDDLVKIGIKTVTQDREINSNAHIEIKEIESGEIIYNKDISLITAKNDSYFEIELDKQKASKNKEYEITITSLDAVKENATMFALAKNTEDSGERYKYNNEEVKENKLMIFTEYYSTKVEVFNIFLWSLLFILSIVFVLFGLDGANEKTFLKLALGITVLYVFATPFPHYLDEGAHFFRALLVSQGDVYHTIDERGEIGGDVSENYPGYVFQGMTAKKVANNTLPSGDLFGENKIFVSFKYFSSTVPLGHSISAIGLTIGHILKLNSCLTIYLARLCPYIFYVLCSYFAIKNMKHYKSMMFIVATLPIAFYVAGSISLDPMINGSALLFTSICLKYYFEADEDTYISKKDIFLLIFTAIFIITIKYLTYTPLLLLFFIIPKKKFKTTKGYVAMIVASIIIGILCVLWQFYMLNAFPYEEDRNGHVNQGEQIEFMLGHPIFAGKLLVKQCIDLVKVHKWVFRPEPAGLITDIPGLIIVLGAILEQNKFEKGKRRKILSIVLITIFILALILANIALYLSYSPVGADMISGYHVRYNIPIFMLLLIPFANCFNIKNENKNYDKNIAFFMLLVNLDEILALLMQVFNQS